MNYLEYVNSVFSSDDISHYEKIIDDDIKIQYEQLAKRKAEFMLKSKDRVNKIDEYKRHKQYVIMGETFYKVISKDKRKKSIFIIFRYPDGTQKYKYYDFDSIEEMREKLSELKNAHQVEWVNFKEKIK